MPDDVSRKIDISNLKYEQAFELLEQTVERMNDASVPLDELMTLYEQGMALGEHCEKLLAGYEAKMEMVSRKTIENELVQLSRADVADEENEQ